MLSSMKANQNLIPWLTQLLTPPRQTYFLTMMVDFLTLKSHLVILIKEPILGGVSLLLFISSWLYSRGQSESSSTFIEGIGSGSSWYSQEYLLQWSERQLLEVACRMRQSRNSKTWTFPLVLKYSSCKYQAMTCVFNSCSKHPGSLVNLLPYLNFLFLGKKLLRQEGYLAQRIFGIILSLLLGFSVIITIKLQKEAFINYNKFKLKHYSSILALVATIIILEKITYIIKVVFNHKHSTNNHIKIKSQSYRFYYQSYRSYSQSSPKLPYQSFSTTSPQSRIYSCRIQPSKVFCYCFV